MTLLERIRRVKRHLNLDTSIELKSIEGVPIVDHEFKVYDLLVRNSFDVSGWLLRQEVDYFNENGSIIICRLKTTEQEIYAFLGIFS